MATLDREQARRLRIPHGKQPHVCWAPGWDCVTCKRCAALRGITEQEQRIEAVAVDARWFA